MSEKRLAGNPNWVPGVSGNPGGKPTKYRKLLAEIIGPDARDAFIRVAEIMHGKPFIPRYQDKSGAWIEGEPIVPPISEQRQAAVALIEYHVGKAVNQLEALSLDRVAASEEAQLAALDDAALFERARQVFGERVSQAIFAKEPTAELAPPNRKQLAEAIPNEDSYIDEE